MQAIVVATGASLTKEQVSSVQRWRLCCGSGCCGDATRSEGEGRVVVAVSDAYKRAPFADALVSQDPAWWKQYPEAMEFPGRKFSTNEIPGVERVTNSGAITTGTNSGLLACFVAQREFGATRILLLGIDLHGSHYFGAHPTPLKNTTDARFKVFHRQFAQWSHRGVEVVNCAPGSALDCFPRGELDACLGFTQERAALST
jgi:hypothetical protein